MTDTKAGEAELYALFDRHGIAYVHNTHPPLFTVEESKELRGNLPGAHVKNMFLKDKKDRLWLVTCLEHRKIRIRDLEKQVGATTACSQSSTSRCSRSIRSTRTLCTTRRPPP